MATAITLTPISGLHGGRGGDASGSKAPVGRKPRVHRRAVSSGVSPRVSPPWDPRMSRAGYKAVQVTPLKPSSYIQ